jgi:hypothetical protein
MSRILELMIIGLLSVNSFPAAWGQQSADLTAAPVPPQIANAKRVFISNAGEETNFHPPKNAWYSGGPNRTYNQFYAAIKSWGRYELVSSPADADLVLEIGFTDRPQAPIALSEIKLVLRDPKTNVRLWTLTRYIAFAGMAKNREKNYDAEMNALMDDVKGLVSVSAASATK